MKKMKTTKTDGDTDKDTDSDENNSQGSGDEEEDQAGKLRAVWSSFRSPPTKEEHVTGSWYAIIYDGKKGILYSVLYGRTRAATITSTHYYTTLPNIYLINF